MKRSEYNKVASLESTQAILAANAGLFATNKPLVKASTELNAMVLAILAAGQQQQQAARPGVTEEKSQARPDLASTANEIAAATHEEATAAGLTELAGRVDYSFTDLAKGRDTAAVVERCTDIHAAASENLPLLADSDVNAAALTAFKGQIKAFEKLKPAPRNRRVKRSMATQSVKSLFQEADTLVKKRVDKLMVKFKKSEPDFYNACKSARRIVDQRGKPAKKGAPVTKVVKAPSSNTTPGDAPDTKVA